MHTDIQANAKRIPGELNTVGGGTLEMLATEGDANSGPARFTLLANTGRPMELTGFMDPVIIDLAGASFDKGTTPVLADHDISRRIGHSTEQIIVPAGGTATLNGKQITGPVIAAVGVASSTMGIAKGFVDDARNGFPFQVSVGARIVKGRFIAEGETVQVNGNTYKGPLILSTKTLIRELSVTVLGADNKTSAKLAASEKAGATGMDFEAFVKSLGLDPTAINDDQRTKLENHHKAHLKATASPASPPVNPPADDDDDARMAKRREIEAAEVVRVDGIRAAATNYSGIQGKVKLDDGKELTLSELQAHAIKEGWDTNRMELVCLRAERNQGTVPVGSKGFIVPNRDIKADALQASILRYYGMPNRAKNPITGREYGLEVDFKPEVLEASHGKEYRFGGGIESLLMMQIHAAGKGYHSTDRHSSDFWATAVDAYNAIRASGFSTLNIPNVLENVMHKAAVMSFEAVETVWRFFCGRRTLNDFRAHNLYRLTTDGRYRQVAQDGELKHISLTDEKKSLSADTFGAMITIDRKTRRNDDLGVVIDQARGIGTLGAQRVEESFFVLLLANPGSFFAAGNDNLLTGAGSALDVDSLEDARELFRNQTKNGLPVGVSPRRLLLPTTLETTGNRLWAEERLAATGDTDALVFFNNPHKGLYRPYVSGYINNTDITDQDFAAISGQSDTQWYLFADPDSPQGAAVYIGFLDGRDQPFFDEAETQFNVPGGLQFRSYFDWGVAMGFEEMAVKSAGA